MFFTLVNISNAWTEIYYLQQKTFRRHYTQADLYFQVDICILGSRPLYEEQNERNDKFWYSVTENIYFNVIGWEQAQKTPLI